MPTHRAARWTVAVRFVASLVAAFSIALPAASASTMFCGYSDPDLFVANIGILFRGALVSDEVVQPPPGSDCNGATGKKCTPAPARRFRVDEVFKGTLGETVDIAYVERDFMGCGGVSFQVGQTVLIAAYGDAERGYHASPQARTLLSSKNVPAILAVAAEYRDQLAVLDKAIAASPADPQPLLAKARLLGTTNARIEAISTLDRLLQRQPLHRDAILLKSDLLAARLHDDDVLATLAPFLAAHPDDTDALHRRAVALVRLERLNEVPLDWRDYSDLKVNGIDFTGRPLDRAIFRKARMSGVSFAGSDLRAADFYGAEVLKADCSGASLSAAKFTHASLAGSFAGADLSGVDLSGAWLRTDLSGANLANARISGARFNRPGSLKAAQAAGLRADGSSFDPLDFSGADLSGADFRGATFWGFRMAGTNLRGADLSGARFNAGEQPGDVSGADLTGANLAGTDLFGLVYDCATRWPAGFDPVSHWMIPAKDSQACAKMPDFAWLKEAKPPKSRLMIDRAIFSGLDLSGVSFRGAWLPGGDFRNAILSGADFSRTHGEGHFGGADLRGADFSYVDVRGWSFRGANIEGARFRGAILDLRDVVGVTPAVDLAKADLSGAIIADDPAKWPQAIDPVKAGVVFRDSADAARLFSGYDLRGADLRGFDLAGFNLTGLDLTGADLRGAHLENTDLIGTNLAAANLRGACYGTRVAWPAGFDAAVAGVMSCPRVSYRGSVEEVSSYWAHSYGGLDHFSDYNPPPDTPIPNLAGENWDEAMFLAAWLPGSNMDGGSFVHATLKGANLVGASLRGANLTGVDLRDALVDQADLTGASLRDADLRKTSFKNAKLEGVDLKGALYDDTTIWPNRFVAAGAQRE